MNNLIKYVVLNFFIVNSCWACTSDEQQNTKRFAFEQPLKGGHSRAKLFLGRYINGYDTGKYVIRFLEKTPGNEFLDEVEAAVTASDEGYGPKVYSVNTDASNPFILMDFLLDTPTNLMEHVWAYFEFARLLQKIHTGPVPSANNKKTIVSQIEQKISYLEDINDNAAVPLGNILSDLKDIVKDIRKALAKHVIMTRCHNDLNPGNIITGAPAKK